MSQGHFYLSSDNEEYDLQTLRYCVMEALAAPKMKVCTRAFSVGTHRVTARGIDAEHEIFSETHRRPEPALAFDPPYEDELDDRLARHLVAYLSPSAMLHYQSEVTASYGRFRVDFLIDTGTRRIAIDYSGTPHDLAAALVEDNDALMLGCGRVDVIYRVRRSDLVERLFDVLHIISGWEPTLFTPYGRRIFASAASTEARRVQPRAEHDLARIAYVPPPVEEEGFDDVFTWPQPMDGYEELVIRRLSRDNPEPWQRHFNRARAVYGMVHSRAESGLA